MYVKIEKDEDTNIWTIIQVEAQVTTHPTVKTSRIAYAYLVEESDKENSDERDLPDEKVDFQIKELIKNADVKCNQPLIFYQDDRIYQNPNCKVKHIEIDGISYFTRGRAYLINDKGQTIQSL